MLQQHLNLVDQQLIKSPAQSPHPINNNRVSPQSSRSAGLLCAWCSPSPCLWLSGAAPAC